jgi:hypothetical protein
MANILASGVISSFQRTYPQVSDTDALTIYTEVLLEVLGHLQIEGGTEDVTLTSGTREYELIYNPQILSVRAAYYITGANAATKLTPVTTDWMDRNISQWRYTTDTSVPDKFYIDSPTSSALTTQGKIVIGFDGIPPTTTDTYPYVRIYGPEFEAPAATSDVPQSIPNVRVLIEGMKRNYASDRDTTENWQRFTQAFGAELAKCKSLIDAQIEDTDEPQIIPVWMSATKLP